MKSSYEENTNPPNAMFQLCVKSVIRAPLLLVSVARVLDSQQNMSVAAPRVPNKSSQGISRLIPKLNVENSYGDLESLLQFTLRSFSACSCLPILLWFPPRWVEIHFKRLYISSFHQHQHLPILFLFLYSSQDSYLILESCIPVIILTILTFLSSTLVFTLMLYSE